MSFLKPDPPTPPNPFQQAAAATGTNIGTAIANKYLNQVNQVTPQGTLTYSQSGEMDWTDPTTGQVYKIPQSTATQTLSPTQQAIQAQQEAGALNMAGMGASLSGSMATYLGRPMDANRTLSDPQAYLKNNPDVLEAAKAAGQDPIAFAQNHFYEYGSGEGRAGGLPSRPDASMITNVGQAQTDFFNPTQYLAQNPDVAAAARDSGMSAADFARLHYDTHGMQEGRAGNNTGNIQTSIGGYGQQQTTFGDAGEITRTYGPEDNFSADRQRVEDSLMARMNPQLERERANVEQRLADQGIRYGSQAYTSAMDDYNRQSNDARYGAVSQAGQEQQRMNAMAGQLAAFQNAAQGQAYGQEQGRGIFANDAQQQMYNQALGAGSFANAAQGQQFGQNATASQFNNAGLAQQLAQAQSGFNAGQVARNSAMQEMYTSRNQPINEISALLSGGQVTNPNFINTPGSQIATTDIAGLMNQNFQNQMGIYNQQSNQTNSALGGVLGLGGNVGSAAILAASDERVKENIVPMGTVFSATRDGKRKKLPISEWSYKGDPERHVGPMAQDVEKIDPGAVTEIGGVKHIRPRRVMGSILRAA